MASGWNRSPQLEAKSAAGKIKNPFYEEEDEEVDDAAFLSHPKTGSAGYMLPGYLPTHSHQSPAASNYRPPQPQQQDPMQQLLHKKRQIEERTLQSSSRSLGLLHESEQIGIATAEELHKQREQLENTERRLDDINNSLRTSERHIQNIKSVFSSIRNYFGGKNQSGTGNSASSATATSRLPEEEDWSGSGGGISSATAGPPPSDPNRHPAMRIRGLDGLDDADHNDFSRQVDLQLEQNLDDMSGAISRLKGLGMGLGQEIDEHNEMLERLNIKSDNADIRINRQTRDMNQILKK